MDGSPPPVPGAGTDEQAALQGGGPKEGLEDPGALDYGVYRPLLPPLP